MRLRAIRVAAVLAVLPLMLSGCDLLLASIYPTDPFNDPFMDPFIDPNSTEFDRGQATLVITKPDDEQTVVLDEVYGSMMLGFGTTVTWRNKDGWSMTISYSDTSSTPGPLGLDGDITFERITDNELWTTGYDQSMSQCTIDVAESTADRTSGSADCEAMRWVDGFGTGGFGGMSQPYIEGQPLFDVRVTFDARPIGDTQES
jgi:hypothetical protein